MCSESETREKIAPRPVTPQRVHLLCMIVLGAILVYVLTTGYLRPLVFGDRIGIEPEQVAMVEQRIDPNTAAAAELARLPGIGEVLAGEIVSFREAAREGGFRTEKPVFRNVSDLQRVKGIGSSTARKILPYLKFPSAGGDR
jgi:competence ComEA-like helix-hairpin-helix protein